MYQTLNFSPPAPKVLNPVLPEVVNYILAKSLAKNLDDRYQFAQDLANDLRQARRDFLDGVANPPEFGTLPGATDPFHEPLGPLTRQEDRRATATGIRDALAEAKLDEHDFDAKAEEDSGPRLRLSSAFDSGDATDRMRAMTGMEHEYDELTDEEKVERLKALASAKRARENPELSATSTWSNQSAAARMSGNSIHIEPTLRYIWIGNAVLIALTLLLLIVH
jgi:serine/threonine-protein kinase